ncbi:MAG: hypothetical protein FD123_2663 [Bacteroidetes bacterium]|nr:MAG: hypothetical protein FD123_2663 [Bacteroidota bacterium]
MKKFFLFTITVAFVFGACTEAQKILSDAGKQLNTGGGGLTNAEVIQGLREALNQGTNKSTGSASAVDGFYKNARLFIPFPPEVQKVKDWAIKLGMTAQVDKFEMTMNRAAETASKEAAPIFINAIKGMTIGDGFAILKGTDSAATNYLRTKTTPELRGKFTPVVKSATQKVELTKYWNPIITKYNMVPGVEKKNPDLDAYVTDRALNGLFLLIRDEEGNIRKNPAARATDILKKVFGAK